MLAHGAGVTATVTAMMKAGIREDLFEEDLYSQTAVRKEDDECSTCIGPSPRSCSELPNWNVLHNGTAARHFARGLVCVQAPKILTHVSRFGIPWVAVLT